MNRADLAWALSSVLPHVGRTDATAVVGLEDKGAALFAYACDRYTFAVARIPAAHVYVRLSLPAREATELMRWVRPTRVAEHAQELSVAIGVNEFHVGILDEDDSLVDSAVFETISNPRLELAVLLDLIRNLHSAPVEWGECIFQPSVLAKFAKAQRADTDRLRILPRHLIDRNGAAVVTVGTDFIGAIAGLTYDDLGAATVADLLQIA